MAGFYIVVEKYNKVRNKLEGVGGENVVARGYLGRSRRARRVLIWAAASASC